MVDAEGRAVGLERAKGREHGPVRVREAGGRTPVLPVDAARLVAGGNLDQRLSGVTELHEAGTRGSQRSGPKAIVGYKGGAATAEAEVRGAGTVGRTLRSLNAEAVQTPHEEAPALWNDRTDGDRTASGTSSP